MGNTSSDWSTNLNQVWCGFQRLTIIKNNHKIIDTSVSISNQFVALYALITLLYCGPQWSPGGGSVDGSAEIARFIGGFLRKFQGGIFWGILVSSLWYLKCVRNRLITLEICIRHCWLFINGQRIGNQETSTQPLTVALPPNSFGFPNKLGMVNDPQVASSAW